MACSCLSAHKLQQVIVPRLTENHRKLHEHLLHVDFAEILPRLMEYSVIEPHVISLYCPVIMP